MTAPYVARQGDIAGGTIIDGAKTVTAGGVPVAFLGSVVSDGSTIIASSKTVTVEGKPIARLGDVTTKGGTVANGLVTVISG